MYSRAQEEIVLRGQIEEQLRHSMEVIERSNKLLLRLSNAAQAVQSALTLEEIFLIIGDEIAQIGNQVVILRKVPNQPYLMIEYSTFKPEIMQVAEKLLGVSADSYQIPIQKGGYYEKLFNSETPTLVDESEQIIKESLPRLVAGLAKRIKTLFSFDAAIYARLHVRGKTVGLLSVSGKNLTTTDLPSVAIFANQIAVAIENTRLFEETVAQAAELEIHRDHLEEQVTERTQELTRATEQLSASLVEKDTLLKEIHHRVKNNLQVISSLLNLQMRTTDDDCMIDGFRDSQNRILAMAQVHEKLYQSESLVEIDMCRYIRDLAITLFHTYRQESHMIKMRYQLDEITLDINQAVPCGLIFNELISNAIKHAFPEELVGEITVGLRASNGQIQFSVADDGIGLPAGVGLGDIQSMGLQIVDILVEQLGGELNLDINDGTKFMIAFQKAR